MGRAGRVAAGAAAQLVAPAPVGRDLGADVGLGHLAAAGGAAAAVLGFDHLVDVVDLELRLDLG